jgi:hypothetical protein
VLTWNGDSRAANGLREAGEHCCSSNCTNRRRALICRRTLQELIAPRVVCFYDHGFVFVGERDEMSAELARVSGVDAAILINAYCGGGNHLDNVRKALAKHSIATRMSWASCRRTTRVEDEAYSLMGLFDVQLPLLYGEGHKAFLRLQEEIIRTSTDQSVLAWTPPTDQLVHGQSADIRSALLAPSPRCFRLVDPGANIVQRAGRSSFSPYELANTGLVIDLPLIQHSAGDWQVFAVLNCRYADDGDAAIALPLHKHGDLNVYRVDRSGGHGMRCTVATSLQARNAAMNSITIVRRVHSAHTSPGPLDDDVVPKRTDGRVTLVLPASPSAIKLVPYSPGQPVGTDIDGNKYVRHESESVQTRDEGWTTGSGVTRIAVQHPYAKGNLFMIDLAATWLIPAENEDSEIPEKEDRASEHPLSSNQWLFKVWMLPVWDARMPFTSLPLSPSATQTAIFSEVLSKSRAIRKSALHWNSGSGTAVDLDLSIEAPKCNGDAWDLTLTGRLEKNAVDVTVLRLAAPSGHAIFG